MENNFQKEFYMKSSCCPLCGKEFDEINGLYVFCKSCDYIQDSTFDQIMESAKRSRCAMNNNSTSDVFCPGFWGDI